MSLIPSLALFLTPALAAPGDSPASDLIPRLFESHAAVLDVSRNEMSRVQLAPDDLQRSIRARHATALGVPLEHTPSPVPWKTVASLERKGYTLRKIVFESRPGLPVPALLYTPLGLSGKAPAVLNVHGHWSEGQRAPAVHTRCVFLARRGFVALSLDAIGAGERAYQGITYHGRQLGYQVLPSGLTLAGLQILDNRRAIDLLQSLPEVDATRIGVTGASGGGNQTFHIAILDERVRAATAVCFYGAYHGYVRGAHCACELVPGVLTYAEEGVLAGCVAPRSLLIIAAKEDQGAAFRIEDARTNAILAKRLHEKLGGSFELREFEGGHDYSRGMREAMVAFFEHELMAKPRLDRVEEPELDFLKPDELRVLDGGLPAGSLHVPAIAAARASEVVEAFRSSGKTWRDPAAREEMRARLAGEVFGGFPISTPLRMNGSKLETEPGVELEMKTVLAPAKEAPAGVLIILGAPPEGFERVASDAGRGEWAAVALDPRGTGATRWPGASAVNCDDYVLAQGSAVLGRPMLGQWVWDALRAVEHFARKYPGARIALFGEGSMALVAVIAAALDDRVSAAGTVGLLSSYTWPERFDDAWALSIFVPGILRCGDVPDWCAALSQRKLVLGSPRDGGGRPLSPEAIEAFERAAGGPGGWLAVEREGTGASVVRKMLR